MLSRSEVQLYKFSLLFLLFTLVALIFKLPENLDIVLNWSHYPILNFDLSFRIVTIFFLLIAFLIILSTKSLCFSEMLFIFIYTINLLCVILSKRILFAVIFYELMSISSFFIIAAGSKDSGPPVRYACVHFFAGVILIMGLANHRFSEPIIIIGLLINSACFPFSFWVVDAYPSASLHSALYLSTFTTKISFLIALLHTYNFWQDYDKILAFLGTITAIYGIIFAFFEQNIRRFFAYNAVGQMGILIITGSLLSRSEDALPLLIFNIIFSIVYQVLFIVVINGVILRTKVMNFNRVNKFMLVEGACVLVAILAMAAFPGTAGFISKSYIGVRIKMDSTGLKIYENLHKILSLLLYLGIGLKFFYYLFPINTSGSKLKIPENATIIFILTFICIIIGNPYLPIYNKSVIFDFVYNIQNIYSQFILLLCITLLFISLRNLFLLRINFKMDVDWIFRALIPYVVLLFSELIFKLKTTFITALRSLTNFLINLYLNNISKFKDVLCYSSVSFVSASSLFLINILLILLCLNC
ncbi:MAG: cation:proton antiporter [Wolbachia endosymbiont of Menacanthus eurysternus]|nr:MAG: cation:proton antiporter [Wolbachia endosymbiont of Menacanthus eurysternus]